MIVYYPAWAIYARSFEVSDLPAERFTHLNYAFANVSPSGECELGDPWADVQRTAAGDSWEDQAAGRAGNFRRLRELKARHPHLRTLISVGGWTWSGRFSDVAATAEGRERFARSCAAFTDEHGFDGLDLDWEYPVEGGLEGNSQRPEDAENFVALLTALRRELDARSAPRAERLLLTIAASASPATFGHQDLARVSAPLDWINLMTYDFHGPWSSFVGHNAPLHASPLDPSADPIQRTRFNAAAAVEAYLAAGVAASRLSLGVPFYGRAFGGVPATNHGLFTTASSSPPAGTWEPGVFDFHDLASRYVNRQGFERHWDQHSRVPFLYSSSARVFISYDDEDSLFEKARLARDRGLGGVMAWDVTGDVRGSWPLLEALRRGLSE